MEEDKIKELFQNFQPYLPSEQLFIERLQKDMDAVEIVKRHSARQQHRNRIAVGVAALSGFLTGVILTLLFPTISEWISAITISLTSVGIPTMRIDGQIASWLIIGGACVTIAISAYDLTLTRLSLKAPVAE